MLPLFWLSFHYPCHVRLCHVIIFNASSQNDILFAPNIHSLKRMAWLSILADSTLSERVIAAVDLLKYEWCYLLAGGFRELWKCGIVINDSHDTIDVCQNIYIPWHQIFIVHHVNGEIHWSCVLNIFSIIKYKNKSTYHKYFVLNRKVLFR